MGNPKLLNLDEVELGENEVTVIHEGTEHRMRVLTVDMFIKQQKRQKEHEKRLNAGSEPDDDTLAEAVELIRTSISEFFPSLPVGELPTPKLFKIFVWLNEMSNAIHEEASSDVVEATADEEGNVQPEVTTES